MTTTLKSRKILSFVLLMLGVNALVYVTSCIHTPDNVTIQALWVIGVAGLFAIGGQALVDSVVRFSEIKRPPSGPSVTTTTEVKP